VRDALARIAEGELDKVVLAAPSLAEAAQPIAIPRVLARLGEGYSGCARFALERGGAVFAGASPERLVAASGRAVEADALAGSTPRRLDGDAAAARELLASAKERREHALVVEAVAAALGPVCEAIEVPAVPAVRTLRNVHHLWSPIAGRLAAPAHLLDLAHRLHPTPAVCGTPRPAAIRWIRAREPAPRGWYAGAVGWIGAGGEGALWLGIRAALIEGRRAWLYAGVGLVEGSDPDAELAEARAKRRPMLTALGAPHPFEADAWQAPP
jgi:menaquinone-specific isochorismate synthase